MRELWWGGPSGGRLEASLCTDCHTAWLANGTVNYERKSSEMGNVALRRSLYVVEDIAAGAAFTAKNLRSIRPGYGLPPKYLAKILGRHAKTPLKRGTALTFEMIET